MSIEFEAWPKTPRLFRNITITEKIDGTNGAVIIKEWPEGADVDLDRLTTTVDRDGVRYEIGAQSRNRIIVPGKSTDHYGFASWVQKNAEQLFSILGPGRHFGEWWGQGIARNYGLDFRIFSLFNVDRYKGEGGSILSEEVGGSILETVPVLYRGTFDQWRISEALLDLSTLGSRAVPNFMNPEGICVYHAQSKQVYKVTLDGNDKGKWEV